MNEGDIENLPQQLCRTCGHRRDKHMKTLTCCKWVEEKLDSDGKFVGIKKHCKCNTFVPKAA